MKTNTACFLLVVLFTPQAALASEMGLLVPFYLLPFVIGSLILSLPTSLFSKSVMGVLATFILLLPNFILSLMSIFVALQGAGEDSLFVVMAGIYLFSFCTGVYLFLMVTRRVFYLNNEK